MSQENAQNKINTFHTSPLKHAPNGSVFRDAPKVSQRRDYITLTEASEQSGYHQDYLGSLCRTGKLKGFKVDRKWVTTQDALDAFTQSSQGKFLQKLSSVTKSARVDDASESNVVPAEVATSKNFVKPGSPLAVLLASRAPLKAFSLGLAIAALVLAYSAQLVVGAQRFIGGGHEGLSGKIYRTAKVSGVIPMTGSESKIPVPMVAGVTAAAQPAPQLLDFSDAYLYSLIDTRLGQYLAEGRFKGEKGDRGKDGTDGQPGTAMIIQGNAPVMGTVASGPVPGGGTLAGFTFLSSNHFTTDSATINTSLTSSGSASFAGNAIIGGTLNVSGQTTLATLTTTSLTVSGPVTLSGSTTIAGLTVSGFNPGLTVGSIAFQGASGLSEDNTNFFYDFNNHRLGIGTTTPSTDLTVAGTTTAASFNASNASSILQLNGTTVLQVVGTGSYNDNIILGREAGVSMASGLQNTVLGSEAGHDTTGSRNTIIGNQTGYNLTSGSRNTLIGANAGNFVRSGTDNVYVGDFSGAYTTGNYNIFIGSQTNISASRSSSIAIGYGATPSANNQLVIGGSSASGTINSAYLGQGVTAVSPIGITLYATGGSGTNNAGGNFGISGGSGTGNAAGGSILFITSNPLTSGSAVQPTSTKAILTASGLFGIGTTSPSQALDVAGSISNILNSSPKAAQISTTTTGGTSPAAVYVSGRYMYIAQNNSIAFMDISNPASPTLLATSSQAVSVTGASSIFAAGKYLYTVGTSFGIFDVSSPAAPVRVANIALGATGSTIYVSGHYAYLGTNAGIMVMDVSSPSAPVRVATYTRAGSAATVFARDRYLYALDSANLAFYVIDISNPASPSHIASSTMSSAYGHMYMTGRYAYVAGGGSNLGVIDVSNPSAPTEVATVSLGNIVQGSIYAAGRYVYLPLRNTTNKLAIVDVSVPTSPKLLATVPVGIQPSGVFVNGRYAYVTNKTDNTVSVVDVSGIETTSLIAHSVDLGQLQVRNDAIIAGQLQLQGGLNVGNGGIFSDGPLAVAATSSPSYFAGSVGIGTTSPSQALDVAGSISNILNSSSTATQVATSTSGAGGPRSIYISGKYMYVGNSASSTIAIFDITNPTSPALISTTSQASGPYNGIFVSGRYMYVANGSTAFAIYDVSNPAGPVLLSNTTTGIAPYSVYVSGKYAYVAIANAHLLNVYDVSNPSAPVLVSSYSPPGSGSGTRNVFVQGRYAYVTDSVNNWLNVIDVSVPASPSLVATTSVISSPIGIYVSGRYAYISSGATSSMGVVDVSNPAAPSLVATVPVGELTDGQMYAAGRYVYLVVRNTANKLVIVDVSSPTSPVRVASVSVGTNPKGVFVNGRYAYVTNNTDNTVSIVDVSGTETTSLVAHSADIGQLQVRNDIIVNGQLQLQGGLNVGSGGIFTSGALTVAATSSPSYIGGQISIAGRVGIGTTTPSQALQVVGSIDNTLSSSTTMGVVSSTTTNKSSLSVVAGFGRYVYVAGGSNVSIMDISTPSAPVFIATTSAIFSNDRHAVHVSGRYMYVATSGTSLRVFDISNPKAPVQIGSLTTSDIPASVQVIGRYAYMVARAGNKLMVADVSNPYAPTQVTNYSLTAGSGILSDFAVQGRYAYILNRADNALYVVDISNPLAPVQIASTSIFSISSGITVSGSYAYITNGGSGTIGIVDISNPSAPVQISTVSAGFIPSGVPYVAGRYLYVSGSSFAAIDVSNPYAPFKAYSVALPTSSTGAYIAGRYAYVGGTSDGILYTIDLTGTETTSLVAHNADIGQLSLRSDLQVSGNISLQGGLNVGSGGIFSAGALAIAATSSPSYIGGQLSVGTTSISSMLTLQAQAGVNPFSITSSSGATLLTVTSAGNVGIGTSTPTAALTVVGNILLDTGATRIISVATSSGNGSNLVIFASPGATNFVGGTLTLSGGVANNGSGANPGTISLSSGPSINGGGSVSIAAGNSISNNALAGNITITSGNGGANTSGGNITIQGGAGGSSGNGGGSIYLLPGFGAGSTSAGFVAVGTTSPTATLFVQGTSTSATTPLFTLASSTGTTLFTVTSAGNVGIGTTSPTARLHIGSATSTGNVRIANGWLCVDDNDTCTGATTAGTIYATNGTVSGGADVAENYPTLDYSLSAGDVVSVDAANVGYVTKASSTRGVLGIISTRPGVLLGGMESENVTTASSVPVALSGRVPVKASSENGAIHPGDYLTISKKHPGYAAKATYSTEVIGQALQTFAPLNTETGAVLVFVKPGFQNINNIFVVEDLNNQLFTSTSTLATGNSPLATSFLINQKGSDNILQLQQDSQDRFLVASSGLVSILTNPGSSQDLALTVRNATITVFSITVAGHVTVSKDTAGTATVKAGDNQVSVTFSAPYASIPKVSATADQFGDFRITNKTAEGFTIQLKETATKDVNFDWIALAQPMETMSQSGTYTIAISGMVSNAPAPTEGSAGSEPAAVEESADSSGGEVAGAAIEDSVPAIEPPAMTAE